MKITSMLKIATLVLMVTSCGVEAPNTATSSQLYCEYDPDTGWTGCDGGGGGGDGGGGGGGGPYYACGGYGGPPPCVGDDFPSQDAYCLGVCENWGFANGYCRHPNANSMQGYCDAGY